MGLTYYIDGYNVIHHCSRLKQLAQHNFEAARDELVERVARFCSATDHIGKIVFDGADRNQALPELGAIAPRLEVAYSTRHKTADALIERWVYMTENRRDIVVVTADRGIRQLCQGLGALVMTPEHFLTEVRDVLSHSQTELHLAHRTHKRYTLEDRLDEKTLLRLAKIKNSLGS